MLDGMKAPLLKCSLANMEPAAIRQAGDILRTMAHPMRLRIVDALNTAGELPVGALSDYLGIAQAATSQHLNQMRQIGLVQTERRGKEVWYSLADPRPVSLLNCICSCCPTAG
jgi:ArsR family transcriptional regulator